jgi:aminoglycoside phosphotransferase family enzyme
VLDPSGNACERVMVMRRMSEDARLSALIARGENVLPALRQLAADL